MVPAKNMRVVAKQTWLERLSVAVKPKIGLLSHHPPRPLRLPERYLRVETDEGTTLPSISIVTPTLNQSAFVERTITSVLDQNYPDLEYVIQDGGSTDGTREILSRYASRVSTLVSSRDGGQANAVNRGFSKSRGDIMAYLNSDDLLLPGALRFVGGYFAEHPDVDVVYAHRILINENDQEIGRWVLPRHDDDVLRWADFVPQETLFWRRSLWNAAGGYIDERFDFAMDWDLLLRFREHNASFVRLPRFLGAFRVHSAQKTSTLFDTVGSTEIARVHTQRHGHHLSHKEVSSAIRSYLLKHLCCHGLYKAGVFRY